MTTTSSFASSSCSQRQRLKDAVIRDIASALAPATIPIINCCISVSPAADHPDSQLPFPISPSAFYKRFVATSTPVLFKGGARSLPAVSKWRERSCLMQRLGGGKFPVALTPNGLADAIVDVPVVAPESEAGEKQKKFERAFMEPAEAEVTCAKFFELLDARLGKKTKSAAAAVSSNSGEKQKKKNDDDDDNEQRVIAYLQAQDGCLCKESLPFRNLIPDLLDLRGADAGSAPPASSSSSLSAEQRLNKLLTQRNSVFRFFSEAFSHESGGGGGGGTLIKSNIFIGGDESVTSLHQDSPVENAYAVIVGTKSFCLLPPTDCAYVPRKLIRQGKWILRDESETTAATKSIEKRNPSPSRRFEAELSDPPVQKSEDNDDNDDDDTFSNCFAPWIDFDEEEARKAGAHIYHVDVEAGDVLYLPAGWYHEVSQRVDTSSDVAAVIAVNGWFEYNCDTEARFQLARLIKVLEGHVDGE